MDVSLIKLEDSFNPLFKAILFISVMGRKLMNSLFVLIGVGGEGDLN